MGQHAASCAWTSLRFVPGEPTLAALYCAVEDARIARVDLSTQEGLSLQADATGRRGVILPYA